MPTSRTTDFSLPLPLSQGGTGASSAIGARANLGITIGARDIDGTPDQINVVDGNGMFGNPVISISNDVILPGIHSATFPVGSTAERPDSPENAMIRGNSDTNCLEFYNAAQWFSGINFYQNIINSTNSEIDSSSLEMAGHVFLIPSQQVTSQYRISDIILNGFGTDFSGGGGDRDLDITDGTTVYTTIPAATLQSLSNSKWGSMAVPFPISSSLNTETVAGESLYATYSGGTTDYIDGSLTVNILFSRIA